MTQPSVWGPPIWTLFHTLIEKMKEERFNELHMELFQHIKRICSYLPCPECSAHATLFLSKVNPRQISNKNDFKNMLFVFHNQVNLRKKKSVFPYSGMDKYKNTILVPVFNRFITVYHNKGNMKMLTETFQRQMIIQEFRKWMVQNLQAFQ